MTMGERIRSVRGVLSQSEFAAMLGIHPKTVAKYEGEKHGVGSAVLEAICAAFPDVNPAWLLTGFGPPRIVEPKRPHSRVQMPANEALLSKLIDGVWSVYQELGFKIQPAEIGAVVARLHNEIAEAIEEPSEYAGAIKLSLAQLRRELISKKTKFTPP